MRSRFYILMLFALTAASAAAQTATRINLNPTTPAAPTGTLNVHFQNDTGTPTANVSGYVTYPTIQVPCITGTDLSSPVQAALSLLAGSDGGVIDARLCTFFPGWINGVTIVTPNVTLLLPCDVINVSGYLYIGAGTRNARILGCGYMGATGVTGQQGGTTLNYTGSLSLFTIGDPTYLTDTVGAEIGDLAIVTANGASTANAITIDRTQDVYVHDLVINGGGSLSQTGLVLNGSGNYTGGEFRNIKMENLGTTIFMSGTGSDSTNASTFTRLHIVCPNTAGTPLSGSVGIDLIAGDGNTFTGGDVEDCDTMLSLGASATNNTFLGLRNEGSNTQIDALTGSSYNLWIGGGTLFLGKLIDAGTHNSFIDAFHTGQNNLNGSLWRAQADSDVTDHEYDGIGTGNVRGHQLEYATDVPSTTNTFQNTWLWGPGDGTTGLQLFQLEDLLNSLTRFGVQQNTTAGGNAQTFLNSLGTGQVCMNCSSGSGTGGFFVGSGGSSPTAVFNVASSGQSYQTGEHDFYNGTTEVWQFECASLTSCVLRNANATVPMSPLTFVTSGGTSLASQGTGSVLINNASNAGTGGFGVYLGGADNTVLGFSVTGYNGSNANVTVQVGSASGYGNLAIGNHLNQLATGDTAGSCSPAGGTTCSISLQHSFTAALCFCSDTATSSPVACSAYYSGGDIKLTAATSTSDTLGGMCIGNPN